MPRYLEVLVIEDYGTDSEGKDALTKFRNSYGGCVAIGLVHSYDRATELVAGTGGALFATSGSEPSEGSLAKRAGTDILLLDVMGQCDATVKEAPNRWPLVDDHDLRPFLPILALPFMGARPIMSLVPFSSYWGRLRDDPEPMVWVALGLLISKLEQKAVPWGELHGHVEKLDGYTSVQNAIGPGVQQYRQRLFDALRAPNPVVCLLPGTAELVERLSQARTEAAGDTRHRFPTEKFALRLQLESGRDEVWIESLFGDLIQFNGEPVTEEAYDGVIGWFDDFQQWESEYETAVKVLDRIVSLDPSPKAGNPMKEVANKYGTGPGRSRSRSGTVGSGPFTALRLNRTVYNRHTLEIAEEYQLEEADLHFLESSLKTASGRLEQACASDSLLAVLEKANDGTAERLSGLSSDDWISLVANIPWRPRLRLDRALDDVLGKPDGTPTRLTIKHLVVVLAQVKAANEVLRGTCMTMRQGVHQCLGGLLDNSYFELFGARNRKKTSVVVGSVFLPAFDLRPDFVQGERKNAPEWEPEPAVKYYLGPHSARLSLTFRGLCQEYAESKLHWMGRRGAATDKLWPNWMQDTDPSVST